MARRMGADGEGIGDQEMGAEMSMVSTYRTRRLNVWMLWIAVFPLVVLLALFLLNGCTREKEPEGGEASDAAAGSSSPVREALTGGPYPTLIMTQAQFKKSKGPDGKLKMTPGPAKLVLLRKTGAGWQRLTVEDPESNVFHKALPLDLDGGRTGILTIGAMKAALKLWSWDGSAWSERTIWAPTFGGKWDRLRDVEIGDVTGDGADEIVIATHDQGVVAVAGKEGGGWRITEMGRAPGTFVHEVEIGDADGDGLKEFFVTPSEPNRATMESQPGRVDMYKWNGKIFDRTVVDTFDKSHAKEILAVDLEGRGRATLFAVVEAETRKQGRETVVMRPVTIKQYGFDKAGRASSRVVVTLKDSQCRFLSPGDVDGDGATDLVAAAMKSGLWILRAQPDGTWRPSLIDAHSSGYEHTTLVCDLEGDGRLEIYVAADDQQEVRRYDWKEDHFEKQVIAKIDPNDITWNLTAGSF